MNSSSSVPSISMDYLDGYLVAVHVPLSAPGQLDGGFSLMVKVPEAVTLELKVPAKVIVPTFALFSMIVALREKESLDTGTDVFEALTVTAGQAVSWYDTA